MKNVQKQEDLILYALEQRKSIQENTNAFRLFNGFYEGIPGLVLDIYGSTLVVLDHESPGFRQEMIHHIGSWMLEKHNNITTVLLKQRQHTEETMRKGILIHGDALPTQINEYGVFYALDLQMNQDASFYLDTRNLRHWLLSHMSGMSVLNTFAYTGSLGIAAGAGGAEQVVQTDINKRFLDLAKKSWGINNLPEENCTFLTGDFFRIAGRLRHKNRLYNCVIIDPPFFSSTSAGRVDLENETTRLVNKVRSLVAHDGWLIVINNALYLSGKAFMDELNALCQSKYLQFETIIPVPPDITGYPSTIVSPPPKNPAPFNHPTKIAILKVFRKDRREA